MSLLISNMFLIKKNICNDYIFESINENNQQQHKKEKVK